VEEGAGVEAGAAPLEAKEKPPKPALEAGAAAEAAGAAVLVPAAADEEGAARPPKLKPPDDAARTQGGVMGWGVG